MNREPNNRAGVDAGFAFQFAFGRPLPGTIQQGRWVNRCARSASVQPWG
jgi:hypothetical protein